MADVGSEKNQDGGSRSEGEDDDDSEGPDQVDSDEQLDLLETEDGKLCQVEEALVPLDVEVAMSRL